MRAIFRAILWMTMLVAGPAWAQEPVAAWPETRIAEEGAEAPDATLQDVAWLVGQWRGTGIGDAPAMESWLPPVGGTMVGTFVQEAEDGAILFTEHMYLMEENGTLVLRLKHFDAELVGWEDKDGTVDFRLIAIEPCAAYFQGLTLRCIGRDGLLAAVRVKHDNGRVGELKFRFERMEGPSTEN